MLTEEMTICCPIQNLPLSSRFTAYQSVILHASKIYPSNSPTSFLSFINRSSLQVPRFSRLWKSKITAMETQQSGTAVFSSDSSSAPMKLLFVEMGVGYDQHGCVVICPFLLNSLSSFFFNLRWIPIKDFSVLNPRKLQLWLLNSLFNGVKLYLQPRYYSCGNAGMQGCHLFQFDSCISQRYIHYLMLLKLQFFSFINYVCQFVFI